MKFGIINNIPIYNAWYNDFDIIRNGHFLELFVNQIQQENIVIGDLCLFDCTNEGIGTTDIETMINAIKHYYPSLEVRVLFNVVIHEATSYKSACYPEHMIAHCHFVSYINSLDINWQNLKINKYFISLQRRASLCRVKFTKQLLSKFDEDQYILSCGSHSNRMLNEFQNLKEAIHPYKLPILVDGVIDSDSSQHYHSEDFFKCFINIVSETSSQSDDDSWREIFLTEKTFKVFAYRQLPIWAAVPGTVQEVRNLGFDVFDDIIDHSYDLEYNESARIIKVVKELERFCDNYTIEELNNLRNDLWQRISNNMNILTNMETIHRIKKHNIIMELLK